MNAQGPPAYHEQQKDLWYGHYPCVCSRQRAGCGKHNPSQVPVYYNKRLLEASKPKPALTQRLAQHLRLSADRKEQSADTNDDSEPDSKSAQMPANCFSTTLPLDVYSAEAIPPIHPSLPYHLSFYHLSCARRNLLRPANSAFIEELSCQGASCPSDTEASYQWRSHVYFDDDKFFQYQTIMFEITRERPLPSPEFSFCRHGTWSAGPIKFYNYHGFEHAEFLCPFRKRVDKKGLQLPKRQGSLTTLDGTYGTSWSCKACLTDASVCMELHGDALRLHLHVYRAIGPGDGRPTNPARSVWLALLSGKGKPRLGAYQNAKDVECRVKSVASTLGHEINAFTKPAKEKYIA